MDRQGVDAGSKYSGTIDCFVKVVRMEGVSGLYSGVVPRLYRVVPGQVKTFNLEFL